MTEVRLVYCTCPDTDTANTLAAGLVGVRLAACVNVLPQIRSIYRWQGKVQNDAEVLLLIKTTAAALGGLQEWILHNHPYDVPEVIAVPVTEGAPEYLNWVAQETEAKKR